jgi:hypothetical protein
MIQNKIQNRFGHQHSTIQNFSDNTYVADYTEQTKTLAVKRDVEFFSPNLPTDISFFSIINTPKIAFDVIKFDNSSFVYSNGSSKSQCECVCFPLGSKSDSWVLFCELKYSHVLRKNRRNLRKAIKQLFKTHHYYYDENIIDNNNNSYLIASLPLQPEPFANFMIPQAFLIKLKRRKNIILRLKNKIEIIDDKLLMA